MRGLLQALDLYRRLIGIQIRSQLAYRTSFWLGIVATAVGNLGEFGSLAMVLARFDRIGGWGLREISFLYGVVSTAFGVMDMLFSGYDPRHFGRNVRLGAFDQLLLRPANTVLQVLGSSFVLRRLGRISQGLLVFALSVPRVHWTVGKVLYLPLVFAGQVLFFGALFVIGATITFWTIESIEVMNILTYGGSELMSYPMHIYGRDLRRFFTYIVPAIFLNYYPALYYLELRDPFGLPGFVPFLAPLVGVAAMAVALLFWRFGIRHYASTGT